MPFKQRLCLSHCIWKKNDYVLLWRMPSWEMFMLDPTPSMSLNGILFSIRTGEGVTAWKDFQHRTFFKVKYLVKVIDNAVALHKAIWLSAFACFLGVTVVLSQLQQRHAQAHLRNMNIVIVGTERVSLWFLPVTYALCLLVWALPMGNDPYFHEPGRNRSNFVLYPLCQQDPLYLQSGQLLSILLVLILAITELFV